MKEKTDLFRRLPSVDEILKSLQSDERTRDFGHACVTEAARSELDRLRASIADGSVDAGRFEAIIATLPARVADRAGGLVSGSLRPVINASGVVIHTNLGRVPLSPAAIRRIDDCAGGYSNLEMDLERGERGCRDDHARHLLSRLFERQGAAGASAIVVNNNAAAVFLALSALARGGEVIVSRGELVEIGGSFRIPDIMAQSGAVLREVGTTNRTHLADYENAITENTRLLLRVHRSNFEITGFTDRPELADLVTLGRRRGLPVMEDLGSGALVDMADFGVPGEPGLCQSLKAGVALVTCSGDKLLGGPQAGLICGEPDLVARSRAHPLFRALRVDKMCYAALEATLSAYVGEHYDEIPLLRILRYPAAEIERRCAELAKAAARFAPQVVATRTMIGGGAAPGKSLPSFALALTPAKAGADHLALRLRRQAVPILSRIEDGRVLLDLRTVEASVDGSLAETLSGLDD